MRFLPVVVFPVFASLCFSVPAQAVSLDGLTETEKAVRLSIMWRLNSFVDERKEAGAAPLITFEELHARLAPEQIAFLEEFRAIDPAQVGGASRRLPAPEPDTRFVRLDRQVVLKEGKPIRMDTQFLPKPAYEAYLRMMAAMEEDLGKRLLVESGYRSPAYQLYLFLFYMPKHGYSVRETNRHVALPGCSEHGSPVFQAIDFITPEGINGEDRPEEFEELQEYGWLHARAHEFGFYLSYPRQGLSPRSAGSGQAPGTVPESAFEPWHWHYESIPETARSTS
jgi:D-alanyl-D-alanine carboxypeptidase